MSASQSKASKSSTTESNGRDPKSTTEVNGQAPANGAPLTLNPGTAERPSNQTLLDWYRLMHLGRILDEKAANYLKQAKGWSYHAPCSGHEGIQLALGAS